jgi:hypothetical protein
MKSIVAPADNALLSSHFSVTYHKVQHRSIVDADLSQRATIIETIIAKHKFLLEVWNAFKNTYL